MKRFTNIGTLLLTLLAFCFVSQDATADSPAFDQVAIVNVIDADFDQYAPATVGVQNIENGVHSFGSVSGKGTADQSPAIDLLAQRPPQNEGYPIFGNQGDKQTGYANALNAPRKTSARYTNCKYWNVQRYWC